jgi:Kef-type K+ transport system membrane component KefB
MASTNTSIVDLRGGGPVSPNQLAALLAALVLLASMLSVQLGISVALVELGLGVVAGNLFGLDPNASWLAFLAGFASIVLTFLAGAEVDPDDFRSRVGTSVGIGLVSFVGPFLVPRRWPTGPSTGAGRPR